MRRAWIWIITIGLIYALFAVGCGDDNGTDPNYEGNNYKITAEFESASTRTPDSLFVEVLRLNPDADSPDNATIIINGITFELIEYNPSTGLAIYGAEGISLTPSGSYSFSFACGSDSSGGEFTVPPPVNVSITSPVSAEGDTSFPTFTEGNPIPVSWVYDGDPPSFVEVIFAAMSAPVFADYRVILPGTQTSYTIPDTASEDVGGTLFPMPSIVVKVKEVVELSDGGIEGSIDISGNFDLSLIILLEADSSGEHAQPVISNIGTPLNPIFSWTPEIPAMGFQVYRNTTNGGQDHTGAIWGAYSDGTTEGIYPPVTYGVEPPATFSGAPEESIITGEEYTIMASFSFGDGTGTVSFFSWAP